MDIKGPVKDATTTAKRSIDSAAGQLQDVANQTTKQVGAVVATFRKPSTNLSQISRTRH